MSTPSVYNPAVTCVEDYLREAGKHTAVRPLPLVHPCVSGCGQLTDVIGGRCLDCREQWQDYIRDNARRVG